MRKIAFAFILILCAAFSAGCASQEHNLEISPSEMDYLLGCQEDDGLTYTLSDGTVINVTVYDEIDSEVR